MKRERNPFQIQKKSAKNFHQLQEHERGGERRLVVMKLLLRLTSFGVGFGNGAVVPSGRLLLSSEKSPMRVGERERECIQNCENESTFFW